MVLQKELLRRVLQKELFRRVLELVRRWQPGLERRWQPAMPSAPFSGASDRTE